MEGTVHRARQDKDTVCKLCLKSSVSKVMMLWCDDHPLNYWGLLPCRGTKSRLVLRSTHLSSHYVLGFLSQIVNRALSKSLVSRKRMCGAIPHSHTCMVLNHSDHLFSSTLFCTFRMKGTHREIQRQNIPSRLAFQVWCVEPDILRICHRNS
jgi:hypothetical protein